MRGKREIKKPSSEIEICESNFEIHILEGKNRAVFNKKFIKKGDIVVEYIGELLNYSERKRREVIYEEQRVGCFILDFVFKEKKMCIDATEETSYIGRLLNHSNNPNLKPILKEIDGKPRVFFIALKDLAVGTELLWSYGETRKEVLRKNPWLSNSKQDKASKERPDAAFNLNCSSGSSILVQSPAHVLLEKLPEDCLNQLGNSINGQSKNVETKNVNSRRKRKINVLNNSFNVIESKKCAILPEAYISLEKLPKTLTNKEANTTSSQLKFNNSNLTMEKDSNPTLPEVYVSLEKLSEAPRDSEPDTTNSDSKRKNSNIIMSFDDTSTPRSVDSEILKILGESWLNNSSKKFLQNDSFKQTEPFSSTPVKQNSVLQKEDLQISQIQAENSIEISLKTSEHLKKRSIEQNSIGGNRVTIEKTTTDIDLDDDQNNSHLLDKQPCLEQNNSANDHADNLQAHYTFDFPEYSEVNKAVSNNKIIDCVLPVIDISSSVAHHEMNNAPVLTPAIAEFDDDDAFLHNVAEIENSLNNCTHLAPDASQTSANGIALTVDYISNLPDNEAADISSTEDDAVNDLFSFNNAQVNSGSLSINNSQEDPNYEPGTLETCTINVTQNACESLNENVPFSHSGRPVDKRDLQVPKSKCTGKKTTKKDFCIYCKKLITKLPRHLKLMHSEEEDVVSMQCSQQQKNKILSDIRKKGNHMHNTNKEYNTGILLTVRRPQEDSKNNADDYIHCDTCFGNYSKVSISAHYKTCNAKHISGSKHIKIGGRIVEGYIHERASDMLRETIFPVLNEDQIVSLIQYDLLIILMGNKFSEKYSDPHQHDHVRAQLRLLGRLKQAILAKKKELTEFYSVFHPDHYDTFIEAVYEVAGYDKAKKVFKTPSVAQNLGTLIKKCGEEWQGECIKRKYKQKKADAEDFMLLFNNDFPTTINKKVILNQIHMRRNKNVILPMQSDIQLLNSHVRKNCQQAAQELEKGFNQQSWTNLCENVLTAIQLFNRRRAGEAERIIISDYNARESIDKNVHPDLYGELTEEELKQAEEFVRLKISGKRDRIVPVLLDKDLVYYIDIIIKYRRAAGVKESNPYLFGIPVNSATAKPYLRACALMRKFSENCGAVAPETLRGTTLRKQVATYHAVRGISEEATTDLANYMGHHDKIHRNVYRLPVPIRDTTRVSKLLEAALGTRIDAQEAGSSHISEDTVSSQQVDNIVAHERSDTFVSLESHDSTESSMNCLSSSGTKRVRWTKEEKSAVLKHFGNLNALLSLPSLYECKEAIKCNPELMRRTPEVLKTWIDNQRRLDIRKKKLG